MTSDGEITRRFERADQEWFAAASGDFNPIHVDPLVARRTSAGRPVVHGVHLVLWALERWLRPELRPIRLRSSFLRTVTVGDRVDVREIRDESEPRLELRVGGEVRAVVALSIGTRRGASEDALVLPGDPPRSAPRAMLPDAAVGLGGTIPLRADRERVTGAFPRCVETMGFGAVAGLLTLSRVVGMEYPGLHSLMTGFDVTFDGMPVGELRWEVARASSARAPVKIKLTGVFDGSATAFFRPRPVQQSSFRQVASVVARGEFVGQRALVVGGSRGLGEVTAKVVAAGGGQVVLTYAQSGDDAAAVAKEIQANGGSCEVLQYDAETPADLKSIQATHLYYYASPAIRPSRGLDHQQVTALLRVYVDGFLATCEAARHGGRLAVLYPSTVFVEEAPAEFAAYVVAKSAGEGLCRWMSRNMSDLEIVVERFPRLHTDQTASVVGNAAPDAFDSVLAAVRKLRAAALLERGRGMTLEDAWDESYLRRENHVFVASDEVVRFIARFLRRRIGLDDVVDVTPGASGASVLDLGCGIGRHLVYGTDMGLAMFGLDLSPVAVETATAWLGSRIGPEARDRVAVGDATALPWPDGYFAHALSDSVLDSMPFEVAMAAVRELARVVRPGGFVYLSVVDAGDGGPRDEVVETIHERGTVQSYFDSTRVAALLGDEFELVQQRLVRTIDELAGNTVGRWHIVARRR